MSNLKSVAIIPARMGSSRFPGKPMEMINGMPMIGHVYYRSQIIENINTVCVATCDKAIFDYIESIGGIALMTSELHERATERTAEALDILKNEYGYEFDIVAMVQGDEPMFDPMDVSHAIAELNNRSEVNIVNLMNIANDLDDFQDENNVKVVVDKNSHALYFSREPIPSNWSKGTYHQMLIQTGLIVFRSNYLKKFLSMEPTDLEQQESCDMLRILEHGDKVFMLEAKTRSIGVDTVEDLKLVEDLIKNDQNTLNY
jgi:3-deoxy-manno-octulosonate cytidylyltransferase (CMP-KDO synthetase)